MMLQRPRRGLRLGLAATVTALACQDPAKPLLAPSQVVGAWVLVLNAPSSCTSSGAGQQLHLDIAFLGQSQSPTGTVMGGWDFDARLAPRYVFRGDLDLRSGRLRASLWQQENVMGSALEAVVVGYDSIAGQLTDPLPGASGNFSGGTCTFEVTGHR